MVSSSSISVTQYHFIENYLKTTNVTESEPRCQQGKDLVPSCSSSQMGFPSSNKPIVTTLQENINSMANILSASQSPKNPKYGRPKTSSNNGFLAVKSSHSSSEPSIAGN